MKLFTCQNCGQLLYFENTHCERCGHALGYYWPETALLTLADEQDGTWAVLGERELAQGDKRVRFCSNAAHNVCNWLLPAESDETLCLACDLNRTIPNLEKPENRLHWQTLETAKHRLVYSLLRLELPVMSKRANDELGLRFDFKEDEIDASGQERRVLTGHANGLITLNIIEADDVERERIRKQMGEPYRTLLGHFRHEVGHYYWELMARSEGWLGEFRAVFGDERLDYAQALETHYQKEASMAWRSEFVSDYASAHPWEDWAETWAHYLHVVDTLATAHAFGIQLHPDIPASVDLEVAVNFDPYNLDNPDAIMQAWLPVTYAVNSLNRSMGQPDLYPFVLPPPVYDKMRFIHRSIWAYEEQDGI